ncbi:MAG: hypothetical protein ABIR70_11550 [Bryobacteraceae bacterium]
MADLLSAIRAHYVRQLAEAVRDIPDAESAYRNEDGTLALQGVLQLPGRADFLLNGEPQSVDSDSRLTFDPMEVQHQACTIVFEPFTWDWATVIAQGIEVAEMSTILSEWFYRWFERADGEALLGVVHFASDPVAREGAVETTLDLGSAPVDALLELLKTLAARGATNIRVL